MSSSDQPGGNHNVTTRRGGARVLPRKAANRLEALTVLCHPDLRRVGEESRLVALTAKGEIELSRLTPLFVQPGGGAAAPLEDPWGSRTPVTLSRHGQSLRITAPETATRVRIAGDTVIGARDIPMDALDGDGVIVELGERVLLLLHRVGRPRNPVDRFSIVGDHEKIDALRDEISDVAGLNLPVLLLGESGTGKELVAQALHRASGRRRGPLVSVNMAAIPTATAAAQLFGHVRGAFTGAVRDSDGFFGAADGGTLFLDEIGHASLDVQALLLRALDDGDVQRIGSQTPQRRDVRVIAATDEDLTSAVEHGDFRLPLLHRLGGYRISVPPLRARGADIARLFLHFCEQQCSAMGLDWPPDPEVPRLSPGIMTRLFEHSWPGNVRELRNVARRVAITYRRGSEADVEMAVTEALAATSGASETPERLRDASRRAPADISEAELLRALEQSDWQPAPAAVSLGISRGSIYKLIARCDGVRKAADLGRDELVAARDEVQGDLSVLARTLRVSKRGLMMRLKELGLD